MSNQPSLDRIERNLLRRGLPPDYVERVIGEWSDHWEDLMSAQLSKEADMPLTKPIAAFGDEHELTETAVLQFRARTFAGRHPIWTFVVAPLPLLIVCWIAFYTTLAFAMTTISDNAFDRESPRAHAVLQLLFEGSLLVPPVMVVLLLARMARRSGQRVRWFAGACVGVALLAACHQANLILPVGRDNGALQVGLGTRIDAQQLAFPLVFAALLAWQMTRRKPDPRDLSPESPPGENARQAA